MMTEIALNAFVTLFVTIDPVGLSPMFLALTQGMDKAERNRIAARACLIGMGILTVFAIGGEAILTTIGIGLPAFRIAGGLLLFLIAVEMLFDRRAQRREKTVEMEQSAPSHASDPSVFPLATPLIAGPGALTMVILLMGNHSGDLAMQAALMGVVASVVLTAYIFFRVSGGLGRLLGRVGINVVTRLLGMLLAALSVQFVLDGLGDVGLLASGAQ